MKSVVSVELDLKMTRMVVRIVSAEMISAVHTGRDASNRVREKLSLLWI